MGKHTNTVFFALVILAVAALTFAGTAGGATAGSGLGYRDVLVDSRTGSSFDVGGIDPSVYEMRAGFVAEDYNGTITLTISNLDNDNDIDTITITKPSGLIVKDASGFDANESGGREDWATDENSARIKYTAATDKEGKDQDDGYYHGDIRSNDDAIDFTENLDILLDVTVSQGVTFVEFEVTLEDAQTEGVSASVTKTFALNVMSPGNVVRLVRLKGTQTVLLMKEKETPFRKTGTDSAGSSFTDITNAVECFSDPQDIYYTIYDPADMEYEVAFTGLEGSEIYGLHVQEYEFQSNTGDLNLKKTSVLAVGDGFISVGDKVKWIDSDNDGIFDPDDPDDDNDDYTDIQEIEGGTDPFDPNPPYPKIDTTPTNGGDDEETASLPITMILIVVVIVVVLVVVVLVVRSRGPREKKKKKPAEEVEWEKPKKKKAPKAKKPVEEKPKKAKPGKPPKAKAKPAPEVKEPEPEAVEEDIDDLDGLDDLDDLEDLDDDLDLDDLDDELEDVSEDDLDLDELDELDALDDDIDLDDLDDL